VAYKNDIFISYRRDPETVTWLKNHLVPLLRLRVGMELESEPSIYTDEMIEGGATWPIELGEELAKSKVLISLWSRNYLHSKWCSLELAHMIAREKAKNLRTPGKPLGVVLFIVVHDGDTIPHDLQLVQKIEIQKCFNVRMRHDSPRAEDLDAILSDEAAGIARAIQNAPQFEDAWPDQTAQDFFNLFHAAVPPIQATVPQFTAPV
jgi:hypothetical protein